MNGSIRSRNKLTFGFLFILVILLALINIAVGAVSVTFMDILHAFTGKGDPDVSHIIIHYRLPRIILAIMVGAGLAVSGLISQAILMNPMAAPDTLGISAGSALGAVATVLLLTPNMHSQALTALAAFAGGAAGALLVYVLAYQKGLNPVRLALIGVAVSACGSTWIQLLITKTSAGTSTVLLWLNGSLWGRTWDQVLQLAPLIVIFIPMVWLFSRAMDILALGESMSKGLGVSLEKMRLILLLLTVLLASGSVATVGMIGFVGLVSPHIARKLVSGGHRAYVPAAALTGSVMLLLSDTMGRVLLPPIEFPAGLVTSIIGAPFFVFLLWRESRKQAQV
ncbi:iron ABC transporter permease [Paenibacillus urinalis]|uniref:Iron ABC transporter permease n=1 Tax=Paenibacillus urinalis TaxID=521520 RepID=A0AAX3MXS9_9BACL|nr:MULTISPECIES: iron ABC transporter permease [Paenibacillus]WDH81848.1 iron ABC transporter permease [Paenibacillus urinalis]WDH97897.1 iron ABC transporter permease [Paenibacillus urinalis]WDI01575.1 iron ABC transporter permease [Paenibacillus urinalis]GAK43468.1 iron-siderophore ABC transporter permease protien [Paenibacillus sp. TCA20]